MNLSKNDAGDYDSPFKIAEGIYWVGFHDVETNLHCNPYLVVHDGEAVLIDGGSRPDFATVMVKILQLGIMPDQIVALVYQHYDPDLCGSMANLIDIIGNPHLRIISESSNNMFLGHYVHREQRQLIGSIHAIGNVLELNGRSLEFITTPYSHSAGSFVTYDPRTKTLFSGDLFGSLSKEWQLYLKLENKCSECNDYGNCPVGKKDCPLHGILAFHRRIMPCEKALRYAMDRIRAVDVDLIAPQHGSIVRAKRDIELLMRKLSTIDGVGIDGIL